MFMCKNVDEMFQIKMPLELILLSYIESADKRLYFLKFHDDHLRMGPIIEELY